MGKRGPKPKSKVKIEWSRNFAYAIGLIVTDGCVSKDGRHIAFVSKDYDQIENFAKCFGIKNKIGLTNSGRGLQSYRIQFSDVNFRDFLIRIGIFPGKSKTLKSIEIPDEFFFDFLRGVFDGDGYSYSYWDKRWKSSFLFYIGFVSAAPVYIKWLQTTIHRLVKIHGHVTNFGDEKCGQLKYGKREALVLLRFMYPADCSAYLKRKKLKIDGCLGIIGKQEKRKASILTNNARVAKLEDALP